MKSRQRRCRRWSGPGKYLGTAFVLLAVWAVVHPGATAAATVGWAGTGSLGSPRGFYTATLLADGRVLVAGGISGAITSLSTAEIYDPVTGSWSPAESMSVDRFYHTATLLADGRVLVAGGFRHTPPVRHSPPQHPATGAWPPAPGPRPAPGP